MEEYVLKVFTPLKFEVRCTKQYWLFISEQKHPVLAGHIDDIIQTLTDPDQIRRSRKDADVYLFYKGQSPRWLCAVTKKNGDQGFLITAYPTDAIKAGEVIWTK
jgi:hypothetical protein